MSASSRTLATAARFGLSSRVVINSSEVGGKSVAALANTVTSSLSSPTPATATGARRWVHVEKRLDELGITLPKPSSPRANYNIVCHASGNMLYVSGHLPFQEDGTLMTGRIGEDGRDKDYGYKAARYAGLNIISTLKEQLGDLDRIEQIVKVRVLLSYIIRLRFTSFCIFQRKSYLN